MELQPAVLTDGSDAKCEARESGITFEFVMEQLEVWCVLYCDCEDLLGVTLRPHRPGHGLPALTTPRA